MTQRQPRILDVLNAVRQVAAEHGEVTTWWYAPRQRLRLAGELPQPADATPQVEVVLDGRVDSTAQARIAEALSERLRPTVVAVRIYRGDFEERPLFRLFGAGATR